MKAVAPSPRRGNTALNVLLLLSVLFGFTALAVDLAVQRVASARLHVATDAAALAGAGQLDTTEAGITRATDSALSIAAMNEVQGQPVVLSAADVETGIWADGVFTPTSDPALADAVRVTAHIEEISTPFAHLAFDVASLSVNARAIATRPRMPIGNTRCYLPVAIPMCAYEAIQGATAPEVHQYHLSNDSNDDIGWAHPTNPSASDIQDVLTALANGECLDSGVPLVVGGDVELGNGVVTSTLFHAEDLMRNDATPWLHDLWGDKPARHPHSQFGPQEYDGIGVLSGPIPIFDNDGDCTSVRWSGDAKVLGFGWAAIFDVYHGPRQDTGLQLWVDPDHEFEWPGSGSGGGNVVGMGSTVLVQ